MSTYSGLKKEDILILVKTYPTPSKQNKEVVCTAGVTGDGKWIRIYPVPFRELEDAQRYPIFSWINAEVIKSKSDHRPESFKIASDSLRVVRVLDSVKDIEERARYVESLEVESFEEVGRIYEQNGRSLGVFSPKEVTSINATEIEREWTEADIRKLRQESLLDTADGKRRPELEKIPYDFRITWLCNDKNCPGHTRKMTEWEMMQSFRAYVRRYGTEERAIKELTDLYMNRFNSKQYKSYLFVGTMAAYPRTFIAIGHYWCNLKNRVEEPGQIRLDI